MAAKFAAAFSVAPTLVRGGGGVFDVEVDGRLVYSKHATGEFPDERRLVAGLKGDAA